jgi:hypothetical protein
MFLAQGSKTQLQHHYWVLALLVSLSFHAHLCKADNIAFIHENEKCQAQGRSLAWAGKTGSPVPCPGAISWDYDQIFIPSQGANVVISAGALVLTEDERNSADPRCVLGNLTHRTEVQGTLLVTLNSAGSTRYGVMCTFPALALLENSSCSNATSECSAEVDAAKTLPLNVSMQPHLPSFRSSTSRLSYYSITSVEPAFAPASVSPSTIVTVLGTNLAEAAAAAGPATAAAACVFSFASAANATDAPWWLPELFRPGERSFSAPAIGYPTRGVACRLPPLPPSLAAAIGASATPDAAHLPAALPVKFGLIAPRPTTVRPRPSRPIPCGEVCSSAGACAACRRPSVSSGLPSDAIAHPIQVSVRRATLTGGFNVTVSGESFPAALPGAARVRFGAVVVPAEQLEDSSLVAAVPAVPAPAAVPLEVSFNGQSFSRGPAEFSFFAAPRLAGVAPPNVPNGGLTTVCVAGAGFPADAAAHGAVCQYAVGNETLVVSGRRESATAVVCNTPVVAGLRAGTASGLLRVSFNHEGNGRPTWSNAVAVAFFPAATASAVAPRLVGSAGGTLLTVSGADFLDTGAKLLCRSPPCIPAQHPLEGESKRLGCCAWSRNARCSGPPAESLALQVLDRWSPSDRHARAVRLRDTRDVRGPGVRRGRRGRDRVRDAQRRGLLQRAGAQRVLGGGIRAGGRPDARRLARERDHERAVRRRGGSGPAPSLEAGLSSRSAAQL